MRGQPVCRRYHSENGRPGGQTGGSEGAHRARRRSVPRDPAEITLLAVTKIFPASAIQEAYDLGLREFGENYVQEFEGKAPAVAGLPSARFHLIGHLQSNKAARAAELFQVIQTVDSAKLARRLDTFGRGLEVVLDVMLEVKLSEEDAKSGVDPAGLPSLIEAVRECANLRLLGLMTMPPWSDDPEAPRPCFRKLRELAAQHGLTQISMGMSNDLETAIQEGSTCVRVGDRAIRQADESVTLGFHSPLPPARTGVADYSAALLTLTELRRHGSVEVGKERCDASLYHLGQQRAARRNLPAGHPAAGHRGPARRGVAAFLPGAVE